ncbi:FG-GAP repeat domain-containing protein [Jannaschia aquimarina]|uniref:FG-GAP repeat domain-containing protein n=1 Tax=Jannaschia aquimarina TaxID=935700 RepID=UPI0006961B08|nr:VCBS repeat-containing protein [Jannaschia aquimarina]
MITASTAQACRTAEHHNGRQHRIDGTQVAEADEVVAGWIEVAYYAEPDASYGHGILGRAEDAAALRYAVAGDPATSCGTVPRRLPAGPEHVFEDTRPRLVDVTGDGRLEVLTVRSSATQGAQVVIWGQAQSGADLTLLAATPHIGTRHRWLAPAAWEDLDGDGAVEIAYVDRPHLAKILSVWRYADGALTQIATLDGVTNHAIGEETISGGVRTCANRREILLFSADRQRHVGVTLVGGQLRARDLGAADGDPLPC